MSKKEWWKKETTHKAFRVWFWFIIGIISSLITISCLIISIIYATKELNVDFTLLYFVIFLFVSLFSFWMANRYSNMSDIEVEREKELEYTLVKDYTPEQLRVCPICGKPHIHIKWKKFSKGKALAGILLSGGRTYGALFGIPTNKRVTAYCPDCGNTFTVLND